MWASERRLSLLRIVSVQFVAALFLIQPAWSICKQGHTFTPQLRSRLLGSAIAAGVQGDPSVLEEAAVGDPGQGTVDMFTRKTTIRFEGDHGFGQAVDLLPDLNADGYAEVLVGAPDHPDGATGGGKVYVLSGKDGTELNQFTGTVFGQHLGWSVSYAGDVNADGEPDVILGTFVTDAFGSRSGPVFVYSALSGELLHTFTVAKEDPPYRNTVCAAASVAGAGDVDNDGYDDLIVGAHDSAMTSRGRVYVRSGKTGNVLHNFTAAESGDFIGAAVAGVGDIDADGHDDFLVGAPATCTNGITMGRVYVFSGRMGDTLFVLSGEQYGDEFGAAVDIAGDLDDDGVMEILIGAPGTVVAADTVGAVYIFSGSSGGLLYTQKGVDPGHRFGAAVAGNVQINSQDGYPDIAVGAPAVESEPAGLGVGFSFFMSPDEDGDGVVDRCDNCPGLYNPGQFDGNRNQVGDDCEICVHDSDGDGFGDPGFAENQCPEDNCPNVYNPLQQDSDYDKVGDACDECHDRDDDGFGDPGYVSLGCPQDNCPGTTNPGQYDFDGDGVGNACETFVPQWQLMDTAAGAQFGYTLAAAGDMNGDGTVDYAIGSPNFSTATDSLRGRLLVLSGVAGDTLYQLDGEGANDQFGLSIAGRLDLNQDGYDDLLVGAPGASGGIRAGRIYAFSGQNGDTLFTVEGSRPGAALGTSLDTVGDFNADGYPDFLAGSNEAASSGTGRVGVYSGRDGSLMTFAGGPWAGSRYGHGVGAMGDVNGDGVSDWAGWAPGAIRIYITSGLNGEVLHTIPDDVSGADERPVAMATIADVNGDGVSELIYSWYQHSGRMTPAWSIINVISGADATLIHRISLGGWSSVMGYRLAGVGDVDLDGVADFAASELDYGQANSVIARLYSGRTGDMMALQGAGLNRGSIPNMAGVGDVDGDGRPDVLTAGPAEPGGVALFLTGDDALDTDGDGWNDAFDNCVSVSNLDQADADGDGDGDACDECTDTDGDGFGNPGFPASTCATDNCSRVINPAQEDRDGDGIGDACATCAPALTFEGGSQWARFGDASTLIEDVNNDGFDDFVMGGQFRVVSTGQLSGPGIYSGQDLSQICSFVHPGWGANISRRVVAAGDVDGDGYSDVAFAFNDENRALVYSGYDGHVLYSFAGQPQAGLGQGMATLGDVSSDGLAEIAVSEYDWPLEPKGLVHILKSPDGSLYRTLEGLEYQEQFGGSIASLGDYDGDGLAEFAIGAPLNNNPWPQTGRVYIHGGRTLSRQGHIQGHSEGERFGSSIASIGDITGDGLNDYIIGAPYYSGTGVNAGRVYVYEGKWGPMLHTLTGESAHDWFGWSVALAGDMNQDGVLDFAVSAPRHRTGPSSLGRVYVYSGADFSVLYTYDGIWRQWGTSAAVLRAISM